jgi:mono/diheme cytochrome c family protein
MNFGRTAIAALLAGLVAGGARAADEVHPAAGRQLAEAQCAECHQVEGRAVTRLDQAAPAFADIADQISTTELSLRAFLRTPHPNMPNFRLTREETDDVVAYILSLKQPAR